VKEEGYAGFDFEDAEGEDDLVSSLTSLNINVDSDGQWSDSLKRMAVM